MVNQDLGRVCVVPRGAYDPEVAYTRLDAVSYNGSCYMARKDCQGVTPAEGEYYMLMADGSVALAAAARADEAAESALDAAGKANDAATAAQAVVENIAPDVKQLKDDLVKLSTIGDNLLFGAIKHENAYHAGVIETPSDDYCYFEIDVTEGTSYVISLGARFVSNDNDIIINDVQTNRTYTATFTGKMYISYAYSQTKSWFVCLSDVDYSTIGGYNNPTLNGNILKNEFGDSKSATVSQKVITDKINDIDTELNHLNQITKIDKNGVTVSAKTLYSDNAIYISKFSIKNDYTIIARFLADNIGTVTIGRGLNSNDMFKSAVVITPRKWSVYVNDEETTILREMDSDLKPQYYIISIIVKTHLKADIKIFYGGDGYIFTDVDWLGYGNLATYLGIDNGSTQDAYLSLVMNKINKPIWMFGDSYFNLDTSSWVNQYLQEYDNVFFSGFGGAKTEDIYRSLDYLITIAKPEYCVLCTGMNDGTDSSTSPNTSWLTWIQYCINRLNSNNIVPILATIPTVPNINHEKKNEWVRNSGYRYIDFAKGVGANSNGVWYENMLSDDNIHPNYRGSTALYMQALMDLPEIASN